MNAHRFIVRVVSLACLTMVTCESEQPSTCEPAAGRMCTFAGTGEPGLGDDGLDARDTELYSPQDLTFAPNGIAYVLDWNNHRIRAVDEQGITDTVIGTGELGDAPAGNADMINLNHPTHISVAHDGGVFVAAWHNSKVLRYDPAQGLVAVVCGNGMRSFAGDGGPADQAILDLPVATAFAPDGSMYIADQANQRIRKVGTDNIIDTVVGTGEPGFSGDGGPAIEAKISMPLGQAAQPSGKIAVDKHGNLYLADTGNHRIRKIDADGVIDTIVGTGTAGHGGDDGPGTNAELSSPVDLAVDDDGNVYIADTGNDCVRKLDAAGELTTVAGICGSPGKTGDGRAAVDAKLNQPRGVDLDAKGNLYIADTMNHRILVVYAG